MCQLCAIAGRSVFAEKSSRNYPTSLVFDLSKFATAIEAKPQSSKELVTFTAKPSFFPNSGSKLMSNPQLERYWQTYLATCLDHTADETYVVSQFGDRAELIDELTSLVLAGIKTATCSTVWEWGSEGSDLPKVGAKTIVLDSGNQPVCILETTEITIRAFNEVDAQFAYDEGEDDRSLESWRREHWKYFSRVLPAIDKVPTVEMPLVCERFRVIYK